jgi:hypothetical protein
MLGLGSCVLLFSLASFAASNCLAGEACTGAVGNGWIATLSPGLTIDVAKLEIADLINDTPTTLKNTTVVMNDKTVVAKDIATVLKNVATVFNNIATVPNDITTVLNDTAALLIPTVDRISGGGVGFTYYVNALKVIVRVSSLTAKGAPTFLDIESATNADADAPAEAFARCRHPIPDQYIRNFGTENVTANDLVIVPGSQLATSSTTSADSSLSISLDMTNVANMETFPLCTSPDSGVDTVEVTSTLTFADDSACNDTSSDGFGFACPLRVPPSRSVGSLSKCRVSTSDSVLFSGLLKGSSYTVYWEGSAVFNLNSGPLSVEALHATGNATSELLSTQYLSIEGRYLSFTAQSALITLTFNVTSGSSMFVLSSLKIVPDGADANTCKIVERTYVEMRANFTGEASDCAIKYNPPGKLFTATLEVYSQNRGLAVVLEPNVSEAEWVLLRSRSEDVYVPHELEKVT